MKPNAISDESKEPQQDIGEKLNVLTQLTDLIAAKTLVTKREKTRDDAI